MSVLFAIVGALGCAFRSRASLVAENLALRQQLAVLRVGRRPRLRPIDRAFWVALASRSTSCDGKGVPCDTPRRGAIA
jgi:hypothetical protein